MRKTTPAIVLAALLTFSPPAAALDPDRDTPDHVRMLVETAIYLTIGTIWYFSGQDLNAPDWDLTITGDDLQRKFFGTSQITFDNNTFLFNQAYHPLAHSAIYLFARANDMSPYLAFVYTFLASAVWEYVGELREKVSINDMIVSPMTGMAWGEVAYQYGEYFSSPESEGRTAHRILTGLVGVPRVVHNWLDDETQTLHAEPWFHPEPRAAIVMGARHYAGGAGQPILTLEVESELAVMPGFGGPGQARERFQDGNFSSLDGQFQVSPDQMELDLDATATIAGAYRRDITLDGNGYEFMLGGGRGYRLVTRQGDSLDDRFALAHLVGPTSRLILHGPRSLRIDLAFDVFFDFSAVRSLALGRFVELNGEQVLDSIRTDTQKNGYYFGWGFTLSPSVAIEMSDFRFELGTDVSRIHSIQGLDRFQEEVTRTIILDDLIFETRAALVLPASRWLDVRLQGHIEHRRSQLDTVSKEVTYRELQAGLQTRF